MRKLAFATALSIALVSLPSVASADNNDFRLHRLSNCTDLTGAVVVPDGVTCRANADNAAFRDLAHSYGMIFAPAFLSPAESLGIAGFAIGFSTKISIPEDGAHWRALDGVDSTDTAAPLMTMIEMHARKGLPFSFELDGFASWLVDSEMVYIGGGIKWSLNEGWLYVPDIAVRGHGGTVSGAPDMNLTTAGVDVSLSKSFGLGGFFNLTPYAGYSHVWTLASSRVIDADPGFDRTPTGNYAPEFVFSVPEEGAGSECGDPGDSTFTCNEPRGFVGFRFIVDYFAFTMEGSWGSTAQNYAFSIGADF